ncbi:MAG: SpoVG family protein [Hydrogenoanaerobacterium sp.]
MKIKVSDMLLCSNTPEVRAVATIVLDDDFAIHGVKVIMNANQLFVTMPDAPGGNGKFYDVAHPINAQTRQFMSCTVLAEYHRRTNQENK